jgi:hypothetical protein
MAKGGRRYARDARGRFASVGATARGGRLAKASGKRATVTAKAKGGIPGTVGRSRKPAAAKPAKVSAEQRAIATKMKKSVASKNVQATRILQKMAAKDGYAGSVRDLTAGRTMAGSTGRWSDTGRGNNMSATRSRDMMINRSPSPALITAAVSAASAGRVSQRRLDAVLKASGSDYGTINKGYDKAVSTAKSSLRARNRSRRR